MNEIIITINFRLLHYCAQKGVISNTQWHSQFEPATHPTGKSFNGRSHVFSNLYACDLSQYGKAKVFSDGWSCWANSQRSGNAAALWGGLCAGHVGSPEPPVEHPSPVYLMSRGTQWRVHLPSQLRVNLAGVVLEDIINRASRFEISADGRPTYYFN